MVESAGEYVVVIRPSSFDYNSSSSQYSTEYMYSKKSFWGNVGVDLPGPHAGWAAFLSHFDHSIGRNGDVNMSNNRA